MNTLVVPLQRARPTLATAPVDHAPRTFPALNTISPKPATKAPTNLHGAQPKLDAKKRIGLGRVVAALGWSTDTDLTLSINGSTVLVEVASPGQPVVNLDDQGRLLLPTAASFALGADAGAQVQAIADSATRRIVLVSLTTVFDTILKAATA